MSGHQTTMVVTKVSKVKKINGLIARKDITERVVAVARKNSWGDMGKVHFIARAGDYKVGQEIKVILK